MEFELINNYQKVRMTKDEPEDPLAKKHAPNKHRRWDFCSWCRDRKAKYMSEGCEKNMSTTCYTGKKLCLC